MTHKKTTMKAYKGVSDLKQLPYLKKSYKGKNAAGGRKAVFSQSRGYRHGPNCAQSWYGLYKQWMERKRQEARVT